MRGWKAQKEKTARDWQKQQERQEELDAENWRIYEEQQNRYDEMADLAYIEREDC